MNAFTVVEKERIASIREIQKNPSRSLRGITRITRGGTTIGFFLSNDDFAELVETKEALSNLAFVKRVAKGRSELKAGRGKCLKSLALEYGI